MSSVRILIILSLLILPISSFAESAKSSPYYLGINLVKYDFMRTPPGGVESKISHDGYQMGLGYDINNYFAVEGTLGQSTKNDDVPGSSSQIDYSAGAYLRFNLRFDRVTASLLAGKAKTKYSSTTINLTKPGTSYGAGVDFYGTRDLAFSIRTMVLYSGTATSGETKIVSTSAGITYYFDAPKIRNRY